MRDAFMERYLEGAVGPSLIVMGSFMALSLKKCCAIEDALGVFG